MKITTGSSLKIHQGRASFQYLAAFTGTLTIITSGMHYGWPSPSLPKLLKQNSTTETSLQAAGQNYSFEDMTHMTIWKHSLTTLTSDIRYDWPSTPYQKSLADDTKNSTVTVTDSEGSWIAVMPLLGAFVGSLIVGVTVDILGRKNTIILTTFPFFAGWIMVAYFNSVLILYLARFIAGIADGWAFTAVPMYIGEIADPKIRGLLGSGVSVTWIFGILLINIIGSYFSITVTALISSVLPVITFLTFIWMPESPYYLLMRNKPKEAQRSLQKLRGTEDVDVELNRLSSAVKAQTSNTGKFLDLFTVKSNRRAVQVILIVRAAQQLSGTTAITFYTASIFQQAGGQSELATIIYFSVQLMMTMICSSIVDKTGRRPLLIVSITGSGLALLIEGTYFYLQANEFDVSGYSAIPVTALIGFVVLFSLGMQSIPILMLGELFPANVKAFALCLADIYFSILATIVSKFFQIVKDSFGMFVPFYAFTAFCVINLVFIVLFVTETKGKTLEEIQLYFKGEREDRVSEVENEPRRREERAEQI